MKCLLTKGFLIKRRHQRNSQTLIYNVGKIFRLVFNGKNIQIDNKERVIVTLSTSVVSAFGTVNLHPTTKWCIEMLEKHLLEGNFLDVGTGSGLIAICYMFLLEDKNKFLKNYKVDAFDIYLDAVKQARTNLRFNGLENFINLKQAALGDYQNNFYSLVVANLPPIAISELFTNLLEKVTLNGKIILSGILKHSFSNLVESFVNKGFKVIEKIETDLWCLIVAQRIA